MKAILSGINVDLEILKKYYNLRNAIIENKSLWRIKNLANEIPDYFPTPETISAAAARTSRSEKTLPELRQEAILDIDKARKSNESIVFGLGHESVAEHAYFNFDLLDVSRAVVNWIEEQRLASFTEKSMRYVLFSGDSLVPREIMGSRFEENFKKLVKDNFELYSRTYGLILDKVKQENPALVLQMENGANTAAKNKLEGMAKEDARYCLLYSTYTQLELSENGRSLERMIRILNSAPISEAKSLGKKLYKQANPIAPSLIKYTAPTAYYTNTREELEKFVEELGRDYGVSEYSDTSSSVSLGNVRIFNQDTDNELISALLIGNSTKPKSSWDDVVKKMSEEDKKRLVLKTLKNITKHDAVLREYEFPDIFVEAELSEAAYAQLKRQRMMTLIKQPETRDLGVIVPQNVRDVGMAEQYQNSYDMSRKLFDNITTSKGRHVALYALPLSNVTRVYFKTNLRELHSMARHREDKAAQWEIRQMQTNTDELARKIIPLSTLLLCGKDGFEKRYDELFR